MAAGHSRGLRVFRAHPARSSVTAISRPIDRPVFAGQDPDFSNLLDVIVTSYVGGVINTDDDTGHALLGGIMIPTLTVTPPAGPELQVYRMRSLSITGPLRFIGDRVPVLVVYGDADISEAIDVGGNAETSGPGADFSCGTSQGVTGESTSNCGAGGSGGGNYTAGGTGGGVPDLDNPNSGQPTAGGSLLPDDNTLRGGCRGGYGGGGTAAGVASASGGGGGPGRLVLVDIPLP